MGKLNTFVHVVEVDDQGAIQSGTFGPDDELPDWAAKAITNPDVWAEGGPSSGVNELDVRARVDGPLVPAEPTKVTIEGATARPPTSGAGSGRDAWAAYATEQGVTVTDDMDRGAIIAAVDARQ